MYNEDEYIFNEFTAHFSDKKNEQLVLYGIGKNTGTLLKRIPEYSIAGLMDGKKTEGEIWGKKILSYAELLNLNIKTIIIIANPAALGVIYHRISDFCFQHSIVIYDIQGNDLSKVYKSEENDNPYFQLGWNSLFNEVKKHEIITFDIFDTLIMRKTLYPKDIFQIVEKKIRNDGIDLSFASLRITAENNLYKNNINPTIYDIYKELQILSGITDDMKNYLLKEEISAEMDFIAPRNSMLEFYNNIKSEKQIYLITDMYLTKEIISDLLEKCGYDGYADIYVSCEKHRSKREGLYDIFLQDIKTPECCLHIGDNYVSDFQSAGKSGMDSFWIMSAYELLENSSYCGLLDIKGNLVDHIAMGLFCRKAFDNPFILHGTKGKLKITDMHICIYMLVAPMIFYFTIWLMQQIFKKKCEYVLYPSRDAFIIEKICEVVRNNQLIADFPDGEYFYTSRRAVLISTIYDKNDINRVAAIDFEGTIKELFFNRFGIEIENQADEVLASNVEKLTHYIDKYEKNILDNCEKERKNYLKYISKTKINDYAKIAFIDFVAAGRVQSGLEKLLVRQEVYGFYFLKREANEGEIHHKIEVKSFYPPKGAYQIDSNVYIYYLFLETLLTSAEATFHSINEKEEIVLQQEVRTDKQIEIVHEIHKVLLEYSDEFSKLCPDVISEDFNKELPDFILGFLEQKYTTFEIEELTALILTDEFLNQTFRIFR